MIDPLAIIALPQLLPYQPSHHAAHPLLADDGILGLLQARLVVVVDAVEGGRDGGFLGEEEGGFGGGHCGWGCGRGRAGEG